MLLDKMKLFTLNPVRPNKAIPDAEIAARPSDKPNKVVAGLFGPISSTRLSAWPPSGDRYDNGHTDSIRQMTNGHTTE